MAFNVSNLSEYTQAATNLLRSAVLFSEDFSRFEIMSGVQHKKYLNYIDTNPYLQAGACGLGASGSTSFDEKEITVVPWAIRDSWCVDDLNEKDLNFGTGTLNGKMVADLQTQLITDETEKVKQIVDKAIFQGTTASGDLINGWIYQMTNDADVIDVSSTLTPSNIDDVVENMILAVPANVAEYRGKLTLHMSYANFNYYKANRLSANLYWDNPAHKGLNTMDVFGYDNVVIKAEPGLQGDNDHMFLTWDKNLVIGTDELMEVSRAKIYFDENTDYVKYKSSWKLGVSYKFGSEIVLFTKA